MQTRNVHQNIWKTCITNLCALEFQITKSDLRPIQLWIMSHTPNNLNQFQNKNIIDYFEAIYPNQLRHN
jgi:hypothetical protein